MNYMLICIVVVFSQVHCSLYNMKLLLCLALLLAAVCVVEMMATAGDPKIIVERGDVFIMFL